MSGVLRRNHQPGHDIRPPRLALTPRATAKLVVVLGAVVALAVGHRLGIFERFAAAEVARETLLDMGPWGYLAFVGAYAALQPFGVPGTVFVVAAPLVWPWPIAFGLSMIGTMAASMVGFSFARFVARDWIAAKIPARFRRYDDALARRAFVTVFTLRLIFWMPPLLHAFFGVSKIRFSTHFWGSLAGYVLPLLLVSIFGRQLFDLMRRAPVELWIAIAAATLIVVSGAWWFRRQRSTTRQPAEAPSPRSS
jgi:uncharacterized membrane protein YdjX (TVP38/TMEM64 family)